MITLRHIDIYRKYGGDGDAVIRCATEEEKVILDYKHWSLISAFIQDLFLIKKGLAAVSFIKSTNERLTESCDSEETIEAIKKLAS